MTKKNVLFNIIFITIVSSLAVKIVLHKKNMRSNAMVKSSVIVNNNTSISTTIPRVQIPQTANSVVNHILSKPTSNSNIDILNANNSLMPQNNLATPPSSSIITTTPPANNNILTTTQDKQENVTTSGTEPSLGYLAISGLLSKLYVGVNTSITTAQELPNPLYGTSINFGYKITPNLATELTYSYMQGNQYGATVSTNSFSAAAKGTMNFNPISVYAKSGAAYQTVGSSGQITGVPCDSISLCNGSSNNYSSGFASIGVSYNVVNSLEVKVENTENIPFGSSVTGSMNTSLIGVQYYFK